MHTTQQYLAALELLSGGAVIEQVSQTPMRYCIRLGRRSEALPASLVQQLQGQARIVLRCHLNGKPTYTAA